MNTFESFEDLIYQVNDHTFPEIALRLFHFQALSNPVYKEYLAGIGIDPHLVERMEDIPFLPITFFKSRSVKTGQWEEEITFTSSGTTQTETSRHHVRSKAFYAKNAARCFNMFYGKPEDFVMLAMLPSYAERAGSSLIYMVDQFIRAGGHPSSGFVTNDHQALALKLSELLKAGARVMLWSVTFAILDFAESHEMDLDGCIVIETGGMKGRRTEITRDELHRILMQRLHLRQVSSEYGMTELMSQAYSLRNGIFGVPPWMKVMVRDPEDPFGRLPAGRVGGINIIDLANIHSCAFVETQDLGRAGQDGNFEVLGRLDNSDIRGCNLLG